MRTVLRDRFFGAIVFTAATSCSCCDVCHAQEVVDRATPASPASPSSSALHLSGQIELARLADLVADRLKLNLNYDPATLKGTVLLRLEAPLSDDELWSLFNRLLVSRGFTTVRTNLSSDAAHKSSGSADDQKPPPVTPSATNSPSGKSFTIVRLTEAAAATELNLRGVERTLREGDGVSSEISAGFVSEIVRIENISVKDAMDAIGKVLSKPTGSVTPVGEGGILIVTDLSTRIQLAMDLLRLIDVPGPPALVTEVPLKYVSPATMQSLLSQVVAKRDAVTGKKLGGDVLVSPSGTGLLVIATKAQLDGTDQPAGNGSESIRVGWRALIENLDHREPVVTVTYSPRTFGVKEVGKLINETLNTGSTAGNAVSPSSIPVEDRWKVVTNELTGSLAIRATPSQHEQIRALIERLDAVPRRSAKSFVIKNRPVKEIRSILDDLVGSGVLDGGGPLAGGAQSAGMSPNASNPASLTPTPPPFTSSNATSAAVPQSNSTTPSTNAPSIATVPLAASRNAALGTSSPNRPDGNTPHAETRLVLASDDATNTLIAMGEARIVEQIEALLPSLDVRQAQVMLEVLIVSLDDQQTLNLGVELDKLTTSGDTQIRLSSLFGIGTRNGNGDRTVGDGAGFTGLILNPGDFSVVLRALETLNKGRSVSMPRLLVTNNQQATLDSTLDQPFATTTQPTSGGVVTAFGGSSQAGTQVTLKPQIAEGDHLTLDYSVSLSAFTGAAAGNNVPPPKQQNAVRSVASLPDGHTVAVGGIELATDGDAESRVPLLGQIPIIGEAFKNRTKNHGRTRFYVFIRTNIFRNQNFEDLKYLSQQSTQDAGLDDGWPVVQPLIIK